MSRPMYYDKAGKPLTLWEWVALFDDYHYRLIGWTEFPNGAHVSTVWMGLDMNVFDDRVPLIFETMVFDGVHDGEMFRWSTEAEAVQGHDQLAARVRDAEALLATPFDQLPVLDEGHARHGGEDEKE